MREDTPSTLRLPIHMSDHPVDHREHPTLMVCAVLRWGEFFVADIGNARGYIVLPGGRVELEESQYEAITRILRGELFDDVEVHQGRIVYHAGIDGQLCETILFYGEFPVERPLPPTYVLMTGEQLRELSPLGRLYTHENLHDVLDADSVTVGSVVSGELGEVLAANTRKFTAQPPDPSAFDPASEEERLLASLFVEEPDMRVLAEKLAQFTTVTPLADYRGKDASPRMHLARVAELFGRCLTEKDEEIAALKAKIEEYESGEEVTRLKSFWREAEISEGKVTALLNSLINAFVLDASLNPPEYASYTFTADKATVASIEAEHSDFPYYFDRLLRRLRG